MHVLKLPWLKHSAENKDVEVYSVSVSADGSRLASGGLDGKVRIWSVDTITRFKSSEDKSNQSKKKGTENNGNTKPVESDQSICRPLSSMSRHNGAVTVVRFSPSGRFLASGSDDKILLIWEKDDEQARPKAFGEQEQDLEHWTVRKRVVAHDNDIQDIAWAPDSSILVTVGLDRSIIIWNGNTFERIKRYDIHQSHVKGIVFDPANKYFATSSDDRTVRIFRYHRSSPTDMTFSVEHVVIDPFKKSPLTSYFRRCSWSPDGQHIAVPNATNGPVTSVAIINRGNWDSDISLIGHDAPCEVCSFSPRLFEIQDDSSNEPKLSTVVATAGQDKTLAIWNTARSRPLVIATEICYKTITDLTWTPDGETLFISSLDGSITCVCFEPNELGIAVPLERNDAQLHRYGADRESMVFPESTQQLLLEEKSELELKKSNEIRMDNLMGQPISPKIEPVVQHQKPPAPTPTPPLSKGNGFSSTSSPSKIDNLTPKQINKLTSSIVITKDGKKRVTPILISTASKSKNDSKFAQATISSTKALVKDTKKQLSQSSYQLPRFGIQTAVHGLRESLEEEEEEAAADIDTIESHARLAQPSKKALSSPKRKASEEFPRFLKKASNLPLSGESKNLPLVFVKLSYCPELRNQSIIEIHNPEDEEDPTTVICNDCNGNRKFELYLPQRVTHAVGYNNKYWAIASISGSISLVSSSGRIQCPNIELGIPISMLQCNETYLLALTSSGILYVWDIIRLKAVFNGISLAPVLHSLTKPNHTANSKGVQFTDMPQVTLVEIGIKGLPYVFLNNNEVYSYSDSLLSWIKIIDPWYFKAGDNYLGKGILGLANNRASKAVLARYKTDDKEFLSSIKLTYLEVYKAVAMTIGETELELDIKTKIETYSNEIMGILGSIRDL